MKTFLAQNQFLSAASLQTAASSPLSSLSEAAVTNSELMCVEPSLIRVLDAGRSGRTDCSPIDSIGRDPVDGAVKAWSPGLRAVTGDNSVSDGVARCSVPSGQSDPSVRLDFAPSGTAVALSRTSVLDAQTDAAAVTLSNRPPDVPPGPTLPADASVSAGLSDEDLYWQLRFADDPFTHDLPDIPDPYALFNSIIEIDVWADDAPLFLRSIA